MNEDVKHSIEEKVETTAREIISDTTDAVLDQAEEDAAELLKNKWILRGCLIAAIAASACLILTGLFPIG